MLRSLALSRCHAFAALLTGAALSAAIYIVAQQAFGLDVIVLSFALAWASCVDLKRLILPDLVTLGLVLVGLILSVGGGGDALAQSTIGTISGFAVFATVAHVFVKVRGRPGLGLGDAKLMAAAGAWLGWQALPTVALIASGSALAWIAATVMFKGRAVIAERIAFGPFIAAAFWVCWFLQIAS